MEIKLQELINSSYDLKNNLYFNANIDIAKTDTNTTEIIIDKKSALEITYTLLDSLNMLDKNTENLLDEMETKIENRI
jgi:hypothetical protein